jgi:hypothetical protein
MVDSSTTRLEFINSVILFLRSHNLDGLDVSWIYPDRKDNTQFAMLIHVSQTSRDTRPLACRIHSHTGGREEEIRTIRETQPLPFSIPHWRLKLLFLI